MAQKYLTTLYLMSLISVVIFSGCTTSTTDMSSKSIYGCISGNCVNGYGTATYQDGYRYVGSWKNGARNGQGTEYYSDGGKYVGHFVDGLRHGQGTSTASDGYVYTGQFANNQQNGQGRSSHADGQIQEGEFINGYLRSGKTIYPSGNIYIGQYTNVSNGVARHGKGTFTWVDGTKYVGDWRKSNRVEGIITDINGDHYHQVWKGDQLFSVEKITQYEGKNQIHSTSAPKKSPPPNTSTPSGRRWKKAID